MNINLIPAPVRRRQAQRRRLRTWSIAITVAAGTLMIPIGLDWSRRATAKQLRADTAALEANHTSALAEWDTIHREVEETQAHLERADALRSKRAWSAMVTLIAAHVPRDAWLTTIATDPAQPTVMPAAPGAASAEPTAKSPETLTIDAPTTIKIEGYAPGAAEPFSLVRSLQATNVFKKVYLLRSSLETTEDGAYFHFNLVCEW